MTKQHSQFRWSIHLCTSLGPHAAAREHNFTGPLEEHDLNMSKYVLNTFLIYRVE